MFWRFSYTSSQIQTLLEKEDVTLEEIIAEDDVLQECKSNNEKLVEFLTSSDNMEMLLSHVISPSNEEINEQTCFKNSNISCELLTCDNPAINDAFFSNIQLIDRLYSFLSKEPPLNPLLASYFAKIIGSLILRKTDQFLDYIQAKEDFANLFLKHINTSAVMDILLRFLTTIDNFEMKKRVLDWLNKIKIIEKIIELFSHEYSNEVHSNAAQILCDIIRISREQIIKVNSNENDLFFTPEFNIDSNTQSKSEENSEPMKDVETSENNETEANKTDVSTDMNKSNSMFETNPLLSAIENRENIERLFKLMFESVGKENCSIKDGIEVLLTLIDENTFYSHFQDTSTRTENIDLMTLKGVESVVNNAISRASCMHDFLKNYQPRVGFGVERLCVVKLIAKLIALDSTQFHQEIIRLDTMNLLLDFMFQFSHNNFLHTQITNIIKFLFASVPTGTTDEANNVTDSLLLKNLLINCKLINKLVENWNDYFSHMDTDKKKNKTCLIGHLVVISNLIWNRNAGEDKLCETLRQVLVEDTDLQESWKNLNETKISDINTKFSKDLVRNPYNVLNNDSNSENEMFELQNNEKINKNDLFNKLQNVSFQMDSGDDTANLFEQICQQRDNMCFNSNEKNCNTEEDEWVSKEIKFSETFNELNSFSSSKAKETMDISDDYYLCSKKDASNLTGTMNEVTKESLTKTLFTQKTNSSLTSSSSDSSDDEEEMRKKTATIFEIDKPSENKTQKSESDLFQVDKNSEFELFNTGSSTATVTKTEANTVSTSQSLFNDNDSPLNNVEWTDFSSFASQKTQTQSVTLNDPWSNLDDENKLTRNTENGTTEASGDNWANFD